MNQTVSRFRFFAGKSFILLLGLLGALFCLLNARGADLLCVTQGCRIYAGFSLFGIGFYIYGLIGFLLIVFLILLYPRGRTALWLSLTVGIVFLADVFFLAYQSLFWPCASCLVVALLIGLIAATGIGFLRLPGRSFLALIGVFWFLFFGYVSLETVKEVYFKPWAIAGAPDAPIQVFFSPVCPACVEVVTRIAQDPQTASKTAFYPLAKNARDEQRIAAWMAQSQGGERPPLTELFRDPATPAVLSTEAKAGLRANKVNLARRGGASVPFIVTPFLPQPEAAPSLFAPPGGSLFGPPGPSPFSPSAQGCSAFEQVVDCEEDQDR